MKNNSEMFITDRKITTSMEDTLIFLSLQTLSVAQLARAFASQAEG